ncbi:uncharacterized protein EAE98_009190 [Botrytis deweyae]|uniref:Carrier domain-containing protein n=1 Tax=Botrytis deweyae TaxID=2478750 RepID=A0ABQ7ICE1_9HELO|nr:uncharacterized protein EAE98_009190 [Botrytis deweyae]KAF7919956.1 hypothetical protein EAE98_009190 [Botrytis deweyae]
METDFDCKMVPVAIIGMGCNLPGKVRSPGQFWDLIMSKGIANNAKVPVARFNVDSYLHENNNRPGSFNISGGYFLDGSLVEFDPAVFEISPIEAAWMDPQQRKLLEVVYEAIESSGNTLEQVGKDVTGCFAASFSHDFQQMALKEPDFRHPYTTTGIDAGILSNRISHVFNLRGPSVAINTACSSSMYALHAACSAIRNEECEAAIQMNTAALNVLSPTNICHTFDEAADGYGRAEGVGALYIKRLDLAIKNGDPIRAVIRSTAVNANGKVRDAAITFPSFQGQADVMKAAYNLSGLDPVLTGYVECHGTGTQVGDPVEVHAVGDTMRPHPGAESPILIGSVKPNVGHSEASSSISTVIKTVLAIERGVIPPTAGVVNLNKKINWSGLQVRVVTDPTPFPTNLPIRRVGVNAFGYGGTNSHAIIENVEALLPHYHNHNSLYKTTHALSNGDENIENLNRPHLLVFSAHDRETLERNIDAHAQLSFGLAKGQPMLDLAYTIACRRTKLTRRAFAVCRKESYVNSLSSALENEHAEKDPATVALIFTGQGAQWPQMGARLLQLYPHFLKSIQSLDRHLSTLPDPPSWNIEEELCAPGSNSCVNEAVFAQPLCTAIQIGLVDLLRSWGVKPVATAGHSSGEIAAAYAAGIISANYAIFAAYYRGKAASSVEKVGAMLAVGMSATDVLPYFEPYQDRVVVACHNSPKSATISGDREVIQELNDRLTAEKIFSRLLKTDGKAHHSHHMKNAARGYESQLKALNSLNSDLLSEQQKCLMVSSVTGEPVGDAVLDSVYWAKNSETPVLFEQAVVRMIETNPLISLVIEVGPHSALSGPFRQICIDKGFKNVSYLSSLKRGEDDGEQLLKLAGDLWARDACLDIGAVVEIGSLAADGTIHRKCGTFLVDLPPYQWNYKKDLWLEPRNSQEHRGQKHPRHDILGRRVLGLSSIEPVWRNILRHKDLPWLKHHSMGGEAVFPAAAYFAMAIEAIMQLNSDSPFPQNIDSYTLRDITLSMALVIPDNNEGVETLFSMSRTTNESELLEEGISKTWYTWTVSSNSYGSWKKHGHGTIGINKRNKGRSPVTPPELPLHYPFRLWIERLHDFAFNYGIAFQNIFDTRTDNATHAATADLVVKQDCGLIPGESRYVIHPASLDSCFQLPLVARFAGRLADATAGTILTNFDEVTIWQPASHQLENPKASGHSWITGGGNRAFIANSQLISHDGELLVDVINVRALLYKAVILQESGVQREPYSELILKQDVSYLHSSNLGVPLPSTLVGLVDLYLHKDASIKILALNDEIAAATIEALPSADITLASSKNSDDSNTFKCLQIDLSSNIRIADTVANTYDLIIGSYPSLQYPKPFERIYELLNPTGTLILESSQALSNIEGSLQLAGFSHKLSTTDKSHNGGEIILSKVNKDMHVSVNEQNPTLPVRNVLLVYQTQPSPFVHLLEQFCIENGWNVYTGPLNSVGSQSHEHVIMLVELENPVLATLQDEDLKTIKFLTGNARSLIWVTCGSLISKCEPEYGMALGWSRAVRQEQSSLDLATLDFDFGISSDSMVIKVLFDILERQSLGKNEETEYFIDNNSVHIGRLAPARAINANFVPGTSKPRLSSIQEGVAFKGQLEAGKICFQDDSRVHQNLPSDFIEIEVKAVGINEQDSLVVSGSSDSTTFSHEISGIITQIGSESSDFQVGDRVVAFSFDTLSTKQRTKAQFVQRIANEPFDTMATIPTAFCTAIYGLYNLASMGKGDVVAIIDGCGSVGLAAIQLCKNTQAKPIVITNVDSTTKLLLDLGLPREQIIRPGIEDVAIQIQRLTGGRGPDIIFTSQSHDIAILLECSRVLAPFSRIVTFGKQRDSVLPNLSNIARGCSLFTYDLQDLYEERPEILSRLLQQCVEMYKNKEISAIGPLTVRDPSQIDEVFSSFPHNLGDGKLVLEYQPTSLFKVCIPQELRYTFALLHELICASSQVLPTPSRLQLRSDASYLLIGCLGGLGRSLTSWMVERGARHLVFLSRSGTDSPSALALVEGLKASGVNAVVLRANVASKPQILEAIASIDPKYPIRGVVHAAMVLKDKLFQNMDIDSWQQVLEPKVKGCLNLHEVFSNKIELDFFVMTSSVSGTLGSAGQSNYAAANSFLDFLARHRRKQGLTGISLILPMVVGIGYVADHPEIETSLRRKGFYGIDESEMLASFEVAMMAHQPEADHIIAGIEPSRLAKAISATETKVTWPLEPRLSIILAKMENQIANDGVTKSSSILTKIENSLDKEEAVNYISEHLVHGLSTVLMINKDEINPQARAIASYGLDSMIGAEFRNWIFTEFKVDIPFQQLLAPNSTIASFAEILYTQIKKD